MIGIMMKKFKHVKIKNTGILFELLTKQITADILSNTKNESLNILRKYFKKDTLLHKELSCYQTLIETNSKSLNSSYKLLDLVLEQYMSINRKKLNQEKYNLISELKSKYNINEFFDTRIDNYRLKAAIYKLFEYESADNPSGHIDSYDTIIEHISSSHKKESSNVIVDSNLYKKQNPEIQKLAFKLVVEKFNNKYSNLNSKQKCLINKYINENISLKPFKEFIISECLRIQSEITKLSTNINNVTLKIKLMEVSNLLTEVINSKRVKDEHVSSLIKYYELIDVLKVRKK
jgi:hypothetical protein